MSNESVVMVGAGGISGAWFGPLAAEKVRIAAIVDLDLARAKARISERKLDAEASADMAAMLRKHSPTFVLDLTVPEAHCKVTCTALGMGFPVLGEKPMAATMAQARKMVAASKKAGKMYMVSQSRRWYAKFDQIHRAVDGGKIGPVAALNCDFYIGAHFGGFRDAMPSPLILDMAIHHFDLARFISGKDPLAVYAKEFNPAGSWYKGDAAASCIFEMTGGVIFTYRGSWCAEGFHTSWNGDWRVIGDRGTIIHQRDEAPVGQVVANKEGFHRKLKNLALPKPTMKYETMHGSLREMLSFLRTGKIPQTHCRDNIKSLAMVFAAIESSKNSKRIEIHV
jgi:predicted dehydrogenase